MFKFKRRNDMRGQWVRASEINRIIAEHPIEEGKTNVILIGANVICDCEILLDEEKYKVVVAHCTFCPVR